MERVSQMHFFSTSLQLCDFMSIRLFSLIKIFQHKKEPCQKGIAKPLVSPFKMQRRRPGAKEHFPLIAAHKKAFENNQSTGFWVCKES